MASKIFLKVYSQLFSESALKKIFVISRKASRNFFEGYTHDYFQNKHLENVRNSQTTLDYFRLFSKSTPKKTSVIIELVTP